MFANKGAGLRQSIARNWAHARPATTLQVPATHANRAGHSQAPLPKGYAASVRTLSTTPSLRNSNAELLKERELGAKEETNDVTTMDRLLKESRKRADAARHVVPIRSRILWSEALMRQSMPPSTADPDTSRPNRIPPDVSRHMHDSYCELLLPFASSPELLEQYTNASGGIRTGMLMEHLDSLAGGIAYKHMLGPDVEVLSKDQGFYMVTASVDRLDMLAPLYPVRDMRLSGQVIHTGRSSMEVAVRMEALEKDGREQTIMLGRFFMVCRDAKTHKAAPVNPLKLSTEEDKQLFALGETHKHRLRVRSSASLDRVPPTSREAEELHSLFLQYGNYGSGAGKSENAPYVGPDGLHRVWMGDTHLEKCMMMFPQERNVHQKIFGGYLMRLAYELGFANAELFTGCHVLFVSLDGISFAKPVPIGSILRLTSHILHTTSSEQFPGLIHVGVQANVVDVATGKEQTTNDFRFTWCTDHNIPLTRKVVPKTYKEAMLWLEGRRALEMGAEIRMLRYAAGAPGLGEKKHEVPDGENRIDGGWRDAEGK